MIGVVATRRRSDTCRHLADRRGRRDRIRRIGPEHSRQVMQRDTCTPAVGGRPDKKHQQHSHHRQAQHRMRTDHSEIDQDDQCANGQPIADDDEGPRITGITREDQTADRTAFKLRPPGKQWPFAAVRTALAPPAPKRPADQFRAGRRHTPRIFSESGISTAFVPHLTISMGDVECSARPACDFLSRSLPKQILVPVRVMTKGVPARTWNL